MPLDRVLESYLLTLSVPIKPGAVHRMSPGPEFEARLIEFLSIAEALRESYERGRMLARGETDARHLGLGAIIERALVRAFEATGIRPITGMAAALVPVSAALGYYDVSTRVTPTEALRRIVSRYMYASPPEDGARLISGLEAVGDRDLVLLLDREGISRRRVETGGISMGDIYEVLYSEDKGFIVNLRHLSRLTDLVSLARKSRNTLEAVMIVYLDLLAREAEVRPPRPLSMKALVKLDKTIGDTRYNRLLGGVAAAISLSLFEEPPSLPSIPG